jgi:hypothetical protein
MPEKPLNIYQRINKVMSEVTTIKKEDKKVNNQYTFVSHDEVAKVMHDALCKHGIVMVPTVQKFTQDGNRTEIMMDIRFVNIDVPEDCFMVSFPGYGIDSQDKGIGKAISYAVKYALLKTFCLETSDDVEKDNIDYKPKTYTDTTSYKQPQPTTQTPISMPQVMVLKNLLSLQDVETRERCEQGMKNKFNKDKIEQLTLEEYNSMVDFLNKKSAAA